MCAEGEFSKKEILYDFLLGAAVGMLGGGTSVVTGQSAAETAENREMSAMYEQMGQKPSLRQEVKDRSMLRKAEEAAAPAIEKAEEAALEARYKAFFEEQRISKEMEQASEEDKARLQAELAQVQQEAADAEDHAAQLRKRMGTAEGYQQTLSAGESAKEAMEALRGKTPESVRTQELLESRDAVKHGEKRKLLTAAMQSSDITLSEKQLDVLTDVVEKSGAGTKNAVYGLRDAFKMGESGSSMESTEAAITEIYGLTPQEAERPGPTALPCGPKNSPAQRTLRLRRGRQSWIPRLPLSASMRRRQRRSTRRAATSAITVRP